MRRRKKENIRRRRIKRTITTKTIPKERRENIKYKSNAEIKKKRRINTIKIIRVKKINK